LFKNAIAAIVKFERTIRVGRRIQRTNLSFTRLNDFLVFYNQLQDIIPDFWWP